MKIEELKHNHSLTDLLKILLFTIIMLAPIGMVATRCLYVIANKNAYQSYYGETINEKVYTKDYLTYVNEEYNFQNIQTTYTYESFITYQINISNLELDFNDIDFTSANNLYFVGSNTTTILQVRNNTTELANVNLNVYTPNLNFTYLSKQDSNLLFENIKDNFNKITFNNYSYLDNVFEYSVSQLEESTLFNWTENTAIYSGINAMNSQLGINSPAITIVLTYWLILTCIYVIIDIVLKLFTYITHMISSRKA